MRSAILLDDARWRSIDYASEQPLRPPLFFPLPRELIPISILHFSTGNVSLERRNRVDSLSAQTSSG